MPVSTSFASRVMMVIGSVAALLALGLPFAFGTGAAPTGNFEELFGGTEVWSGWSLARASRSDGHLPLPTAMVILLVAACVGLVVLCWLALERSGDALPTAVGALGTALLFSSALIGNAVSGKFGDGHESTSAWGLPVWRVALLLVVVAAGRALLQTQAPQVGLDTTQPDSIDKGTLGRPPLGC